MTETSVFDEIKSIIHDEWPGQSAGERVEMSTAIFYEGVGLDSVDGVTLVLALEERFGIVIDQEELSAGAFETIGHLVRFVEVRLRDSAGGEPTLRTSIST